MTEESKSKVKISIPFKIILKDDLKEISKRADEELIQICMENHKKDENNYIPRFDYREFYWGFVCWLWNKRKSPKEGQKDIAKKFDTNREAINILIKKYEAQYEMLETYFLYVLFENLEDSDNNEWVIHLKKDGEIWEKPENSGKTAEHSECEQSNPNNIMPLYSEEKEIEGTQSKEEGLQSEKLEDSTFPPFNI